MRDWLFEDALLQPLVLTLEHPLGNTVSGFVGVAADSREERADPQASGLAEVVRQRDRVGVRKTLSAGARGRHREKFRPDIDEATEEYLLSFEARSKFCHGMEERPREPLSRTASPPHVP